MTRRPAAVLALLLVAGCGSAAPVGTGPAAGAGAARTVACSTARVTASVGQTVRLTDCGSGTTASVETGPVAQTGPYDFRADGAGTATIRLVHKPPVCPAGQLCPLYRIADGTVTIVAS